MDISAQSRPRKQTPMQQKKRAMVLRPFHCLANPNRSSSMASNPSVAVATIAVRRLGSTDVLPRNSWITHGACPLLAASTSAVAPSVSWNVPGAHLVHAACRPSGLYVPAAQGVCAVLPNDARWPASAAVHWEAAVRIVELEYVPGAQGTGQLIPFPQKLPPVQLSGCSVPSGQ